ncbi:30S ribosomal protein S4 [Candidatus Saccharibacteria bacterium]|jgi:small subunit ribosomal protein S4|nr:30S ribosomal protein S4 [Candidatus Saccharibacteria bacterium]
MARDTQSIVKMSRREGYALHPKAHKALAKRTSMPGQAANSRGPRGAKASQYSIQLREKQKVKRLYGLLEKQFSNLMKEATRKQGQSGAVLLQLLEQRADNVIYRAGFATSRRAARQLVTHGHFTLNGTRVDIPSIRMKPGDTLTVREHSTKTEYFKKLDEVSPAPADNPGWLKVERKKASVSVTGLPSRDDAEVDINEQLIVEYYSR